MTLEIIFAHYFGSLSAFGLSVSQPRQPGDFRKLTFRRKDGGAETSVRYRDGTVRMFADE